MHRIGKTGITAGKPIKCGRCGKVVGYVRLKWRFKARLVFWGVLIGLGLQIIESILEKIVLGLF